MHHHPRTAQGANPGRRYAASDRARLAGLAKVADNPGRLLRTAVCRGVHPIELRFHRATSAVISIDIGGPRFEINVTDVEAFAKLDGFANALEMGRFFRKLHGPGPFRGVLIRW